MYITRTLAKMPNRKDRCVRAWLISGAGKGPRERTLEARRMLEHAGVTHDNWPRNPFGTQYVADLISAVDRGEFEEERTRAYTKPKQTFWVQIEITVTCESCHGDITYWHSSKYKKPRKRICRECRLRRDREWQKEYQKKRQEQR